MDTIKVSGAYLRDREQRTVDAGYSCPQWIKFCTKMLELRYSVEMREARDSVSKYITVRNGDRKFTVRYSNHGATRLKDDPCDFFVGRNSFGTTNTAQAIEATTKALGEASK